jgi:hypothetical protein
MPNVRYPISPEDEKRLNNNFSYHSPISDQAARYGDIRTAAKRFAEVILQNCPPSRERSLAMTDLETAVMWSNGSIARTETE